MPRRKPSPEETRIINTHLAAILEELNAADIFSNAVVAFVALKDWDYHLATMIGEVDGSIEEALDALVRYAHEELGNQITGTEHRAAETSSGRVEGIVMDRAVTESMGWRRRLESVRKIPREGAKTMMISVELLDDVLAALDHVKKLEMGIAECEDDGGCRASKLVKEAGSQRPPPN